MQASKEGTSPCFFFFLQPPYTHGKTAQACKPKVNEGGARPGFGGRTTYPLTEPQLPSANHHFQGEPSADQL